MLEYSYLSVDHVIESIKRLFTDNAGVFAVFMSKYFGLDADDVTFSKLEQTLRELLVGLHQAAVGYDKSMRNFDGLVLSASGMVQAIDFLHIRLKGILQKQDFATGLYQLICTLGLPKCAHDTFVKATKSLPGFEKISFHLIPTGKPPRRLFLSNPSAASSSKPTQIPARPTTRAHAASKPPATIRTTTCMRPVMTTSTTTPTSSKTASDTSRLLPQPRDLSPPNHHHLLL